MDILTAEQFTALTQDNHAKILSDSTEGPKVLQKPNGDIVKIFYSSKKKSLFSLPHAVRFSRSARGLNAAGFLAPTIKALAYYPSKKAHILTYTEIPGEDFRALSSPADPGLLKKLPAFLAALHQKGIFYRGIHLGNVLLAPQEEIALIDITNVAINNKPLSLKQRAKNLAHFVYYWRDTEVFRAYRRRHFLQQYALAAALSNEELKKLRHFIAMRLMATKKKRTQNVLSRSS